MTLCVSQIRMDYGGNAGGTEVSLMILDHHYYSSDDTVPRKYLPIVEQTMEFFMHHYPIQKDTGKISVFPSQALETFWCDAATN